MVRNLCVLSDKTLIMWELTRDETSYGNPKRRLRGHSHFVSDVVMSSDGQFALSGSWDGTLRLWDLQTLVLSFGLQLHSMIVQIVFPCDTLMPPPCVVDSGNVWFTIIAKSWFINLLPLTTLLVYALQSYESLLSFSCSRSPHLQAFRCNEVLEQFRRYSLRFSFELYM